ncbi:unnamed protein product, partial [Musa acuminata subsp. burmannicoides]
RRGSPRDVVVADVRDPTGHLRGARWVQQRPSTCTKVGSATRPDPSDDQVSDG